MRVLLKDGDNTYKFFDVKEIRVDADYGNYKMNCHDCEIYITEDKE